MFKEKGQIMAEKKNKVMEFVKTHKGEIAGAAILTAVTVFNVALAVKTGRDLDIANEALKEAGVALLEDNALLERAKPIFELCSNASGAFVENDAETVFSTVGNLGVVGEHLVKDTGISKDTGVTGVAVFVK